ncbi:MAG: carbohydrate-binding family 9-like protein [Prevotella sp.]|jgi:hypothetical protein|nr:hypothetical protein [Prevotella sp.]MCI1282936.1 carbohydrate-binding family 9-like protein [Prevotella sp.]
MKKLIVNSVPEGLYEAENIPALFEKEGIEYHPVDEVNWASEYPYKPKMEFAIAHTDHALLIHYRVEEDSVASVAGHDNGKVWEDSCCEFFSIPADDGIYYNMECNCTGTLLVAAGPEREGRTHAPQAVLQAVKRWSSLGDEPFSERIGAVKWQMALVIPLSTYFLHDIQSLNGQTIRANFYKCGDKLQRPHFLSWNPIAIEKPDFHRPDYFGELSFR